MNKIAIIGDSESVLAFQAVGMDSFFVTKSEVEIVLKKQFHSKKYAIIFLSETLVEGLSDFLNEVSRIPLPAITVIPISREKKNLGLERMKKICIHATGTDIISKEARK